MKKELKIFLTEDDDRQAALIKKSIKGYFLIISGQLK
jgi:hypothetical protein